MAIECSRCGKYLNYSAENPCVSAGSLGPGVFHYECAKTEWAEIANGREAHKAEVSAKRSAIMLARPRSCTSCGEPVVGSSECESCVIARQEAEHLDED